MQDIGKELFDASQISGDPDKIKYDMTKSGEDKGLILPYNGLDQKNTVLLPDTLGNLKYIFQDILDGNEEALNRPEFKALNFNNIKAAIEWLAKTNSINDIFKNELLAEGWRLNFKCRPPTPEEFLTEKYLGPTAETLYEPVRKAFIEFMNPLSPYRNAILSLHIGWGKSALSAIIQLYISTHFAMMWHPYKYFGQSSATVYIQALGAWSQKKGSEILLEPILNIINSSPYFKQVRGSKDITDEEASPDEVANQLLWTTASKTSCLTMQGGVNYKTVAGDKDIIGSTIISGILTELAFFEENGWSADDVMKFFTKLRSRIDSRMFGNYYGRFILDSSPNNLESAIDKWIHETAPKDPKNYILTGSRWKYFPKGFEHALDENGQVKHDLKVAFPLFKGGSGKPTTVIENAEQLATYNDKDIIWCPKLYMGPNGEVNYKIQAQENPIQFMRDLCGQPSGAADRIFYEQQVVEDAFNNNLRNVFSNIIALKEEEPEHLIWNQVKDIFFNKVMENYYFYYEPSTPRSASVDLAISGDTASIAISHVEWSPVLDDEGNQLKMYVTDFTIPVIPKGGMINLDAFKFFLMDLVTLGHMNISHVSFDGFQSRSIMQSLERFGFEVELLSVDKVNVPYNAFIDYAFHRRWACGKNIMAKNNMLSLEYAKRQSGSTKVDHKKGKNVYTDSFCQSGATYTESAWDKSQIGYFAKDNLDSVVASISLLDTYPDEFIPRKVWDPGAALERSYEIVKNKTNTFMNSLGLYL